MEALLTILVSPVAILLLLIFIYLVPITLLLKKPLDPVNKILWFIVVLMFSWPGYIAFKLAGQPKATAN